MLSKQSAEIDPLLEPLLLLTGDEEIDQFLSQLIVNHAEPVIKGIIRYKLHLNPDQMTGPADAHDIHQEVVTQLVAALQQLRQQPDVYPISDFRGLTAVITHRACSRWMRQRFPERHAFKNRLYYLLSRHRSFALWPQTNKKLIAGFAVWRGRKDVATDQQLERLSNDEVLLARLQSFRAGRTGKASRSEDWGEGLSEIFNRLGGPVDFDRLVGTLTRLLQIKDQPIESIDQIQDAVAFEASDRRPDAAWQVEKKICLQRLWEEICQLPLNQRAALLLNLRNQEGRGCIALFPAVGIATLRQLAETLEMSEKKLAELWNDLPLEDARIAEILQLTRQQVINVRKSARERLARRLRGFI